MGIFDNVLLVSDFDGTLADPQGKITPEVRGAIHFFIENGGKFTVSTGRTRLGFHAWEPDIINAPVLLANGGLAYDYSENRVVDMHGIGEEGPAFVRWVMENCPELCIEIYSLDRAYLINSNDISRQHFADQSIEYDVLTDPERAPRPWQKVMISGNEAEIRLKSENIQKSQTDVGILDSRGKYLEVLKKGMNKGIALHRLASLVGVSTYNIYAAGDGYNDVEMLRAARLGFVPANGDERALACADVVVPSNAENAIAHVIAHLARIYGEK